LAKEWRSVNDLYYSKSPVQTKTKPEQVEEEQKKKDDGPEVRLSDGKFIAGSEGFLFNKKCKVKVKVDYLKKTSRKKVTFQLFVVHNNEDEDLAHHVEGYEDKGFAEAEVTLFYGDKYQKALQKDPAAKCSYKFKASHSKGEKEIESDLLDMPYEKNLVVDFIEIVDGHFHHNCALPCLDEKGNLITALSSVFVHAAKNNEKELIVEGHADQSGDDEYNLRISKRRAEAIKALLEDEKELWNGVVDANGKDQKIETEDYQQTLKSLAVKYGWPCDPGKVDNKNGPKTENGVRNFQKEYNSRFMEKGELTVDGKMGPKTWEAVFNVLRSLLIEGLKSKNLDSPPELTYGYPDGDGIYPCGECSPVTDLEKSEEDRRVELVFYNAGEWSPAKPPAAGRKIDKSKDPVSEQKWGKKAIPLDEIILPEIRIVSIDDHFAPCKEKLVVNYEMKYVAEADMQLEVSGDQYPNNPVYTIQLSADEKSDGKHTFEWDGMTNCTDGPLKDAYVNPLFAPYTIRIYKNDTFSATNQFKVLYHSIALSIGSYTADGKEPDKAADLIKWVQYKLNTLGYFAGPVDGVKNDQTIRAIKRYTYAMPGMNEIDDENNADFQSHLEKGDGKRSIIEGNTLPEKGKSAKVFIDSDYFYEDLNTEFMNSQGHGDKEKDKLDRVEFPLEVTIYLSSKNDKNGSGKGIEAPETIGDAEIEWNVSDPVEDVSIIPQSTDAIPSHALDYVKSTLKGLGQNSAVPENAGDNCPSANNGVRGTNKDYFLAGQDLLPFSSNVSGDRVFSKVHYDSTVEPNKIGKTGIIFLMSYIAGDNYAIKAAVCFENSKRKDGLIKMHEEFTGKKISEILFVQTGKMTLWRRHHVADEVNWPAPKTPIKWGDVVKAYKMATSELQTNHTVKTIQNFFNNHDKKQYENIIKLHFSGTGIFSSAEINSISFNDKGMYPFPISQQGSMSPKIYKKLLIDKVKKFSNTTLLMMIANYTRLVCKRTNSSGAIVMNVNWMEKIKVKHSFLFISWEKEYIPKNFCIGLRSGVTIIDNEYSKELQDGFLISHEVGHCRYLTHHETKGSGNSDNPNDHDRNDHNCIMCYPWGIKSRNVAWKRNDKETATFCGKCILKLRGWKVANGGLPAQS